MVSERFKNKVDSMKYVRDKQQLAEQVAERNFWIKSLDGFKYSMEKLYWKY